MVDDPHGGVVRLMGLHEIAELLDVSRARADQLVRQRDFPKPVAELKAGRIWRAEAVERWKEQRGR